MALDTAAKRYSALAARFGRLPFGRRFRVPLPDGTIGQGDRQHLAGYYSGIVAAAEPEDTTPVFRPRDQSSLPFVRHGPTATLATVRSRDATSVTVRPR